MAIFIIPTRVPGSLSDWTSVPLNLTSNFARVSRIKVRKRALSATMIIVISKFKSPPHELSTPAPSR